MKKSWRIVGLGISLLVAAGVLLSPQTENQPSPYELIRFHVLANSDEAADQALKLQVRDRIMAAMGESMAQVKTIEESRFVLQQQLDRIQQIAEEEIRKNESDYEVTVALGTRVFPTRRYGTAVFPAGEYEALTVVIGEGAGANWWCVMFPPLCFVDIKNGLVDEATRLELESVLSQEDQGLEIEVRSVLWDLYVKSREQFNHFASQF